MPSQSLNDGPGAERSHSRRAYLENEAMPTSLLENEAIPASFVLRFGLI
jgi:hypothetical protein